jgi:hypothetical protein
VRGGTGYSSPDRFVFYYCGANKASQGTEALTEHWSTIRLMDIIGVVQAQDNHLDTSLKHTTHAASRSAPPPTLNDRRCRPRVHPARLKRAGPRRAPSCALHLVESALDRQFIRLELGHPLRLFQLIFRNDSLQCIDRRERHLGIDQPSSEKSSPWLAHIDTLKDTTSFPMPSVWYHPFLPCRSRSCYEPRSMGARDEEVDDRIW